MPFSILPNNDKPSVKEHSLILCSMLWDRINQEEELTKPGELIRDGKYSKHLKPERGLENTNNLAHGVQRVLESNEMHISNEIKAPTQYRILPRRQKSCSNHA
jgi:hypothetical protein